MILHDSPFGGRSRTLACDIHLSPDCLDILDPGAADAPMGGWASEAEAIEAGLSRGWAIDIFTIGTDACPPCARARLGIGALLDALDGEVRS